MDKRDKDEIYAFISILVLFVTMFFFETEQKGFLGWENFFVSVFNQCISFVFPFFFVKFYHIKSKALNVLKDVFFIVLFLALDSTVEVRLDLPTSVWSYILIAVGIVLCIILILFMSKAFNNRDNPDYTARQKGIDLIVFICVSVVTLIVFLIICALKSCR